MLLRRWAPLLVLASTLAASVLLYQRLSDAERDGLSTRLAIKAAAIKDDLQDNIGFRANSIARLARVWEGRGDPSVADWQRDARIVLEDTQGMKAIVWAGRDGKTVSVAGDLAGAAIAPHPMPLEKKTPVLTGQVPLDNGRTGLVFSVPIYDGEAFMGVLSGVFDSRETFEGILSRSRHAHDEYSVLVAGNGMEVFRGGVTAENEWAQSVPLSMPGADWTVKVWPSRMTVERSLTVFPSVVLGLGVLSSVLLSVLIYIVGYARLKGKGLESVNALLRAEIDERARTEEELRRSDDKFRGLVEASTDLIWEMDGNARYTYVSPKAKDILGYEPEEVLGKAPWEFMAPEEAERVKEEFASILEARRPFSLLEKTKIRKDGAAVVLETSGVPVLGPSGLFSGYRGIARDVTRRRLAEDALRKSQASLNNAQRIAQMGSWEWDIEKDDLFWSEGIYRMFGITPGSFGATYEAFLGFVHPEDRLFVHKSVTEALTLKKPYSIEHRIILPDGTEKVVHEQGEVAFNADGVPERMSGTVQDITERKRTEEQLRLYREHLKELVEERTAELKALNQKLAFEVEVRKKAQDAVEMMNEDLEKRAGELERVNKELEAFTYSASHDLQEPLRVISGYVQLLSRRYAGKLDKDADEFIFYAVDGVARMQRLINDLLSYSRIGRLKGLKRVDCEAALARAVSNLKALVDESQAIIRHGALPSIEADESQLEQLFMNLISNAVKYRSEDRPLITVCALKQEGEWLFSVTDNGIGIEPKYSDKIFDLFQRLHRNPGQPGTGIGLSICKKVVENHGGRIWVESMPGAGSTFYFTIPLREAVNA